MYILGLTLLSVQLSTKSQGRDAGRGLGAVVGNRGARIICEMHNGTLPSSLPPIAPFMDHLNVAELN